VEHETYQMDSDQRGKDKEPGPAAAGNKGRRDLEDEVVWHSLANWSGGRGVRLAEDRNRRHMVVEDLELR
jgi:hypothetical protein